MTPSLYDLLDVDPRASDDEIRAAWRAAIADLDPTDRRFRAYNRAAETLLDPERRAEHDAVLAAEDAADEEDDEPAATPTAVPTTSPAKKTTEPESAAKKSAAKKPAAKKPAAKKPAAKKTAAAGATAVPAEDDEGPAASTARERMVASATRGTEAGSERSEPPTWVLAVVAVLTIGVLVATWLVWSGDDEAQASSSATQAAEDAAVAAAVPVLSYDWRSLDEGEATARTYLTDEYAQDYGELVDGLTPDARRQHIVVDAEVMASGISRTGDDRVDVLVFVNQVTQKLDSQPFTLKMWATMQMVRQDDEWLVDQLVVDTVSPEETEEPAEPSSSAPTDDPSTP